MKYSLDRYKYYSHNNEVIAVSSFAGRTVRGTAKCNPNDEFDVQKGKELAAARCNEKVARKRLKRAAEKYKEAAKVADDAIAWYDRMKEYYMDSVDAYDEANAELIKLAETL